MQQDFFPHFAFLNEMRNINYIKKNSIARKFFKIFEIFGKKNEEKKKQFI